MTKSMDKETMEREFYITRQCMKFFHPLYKVKIKTEILFKPLVDSYPFYPFFMVIIYEQLYLRNECGGIDSEQGLLSN